MTAGAGSKLRCNRPRLRAADGGRFDRNPRIQARLMGADSALVPSNSVLEVLEALGMIAGRAEGLS